MSNKKRKVRNEFLIVGWILVFFCVYLVTFNNISNKQDKIIEENIKKTQTPKIDNRDLLTQIKDQEAIYIDDDQLKDVYLEEEYWRQFKFFFEDFKGGVRKPDTYKPIYEGHSDNNIRFSTDLSYFRVYTVNKEEYYKVPAYEKKEFEAFLNKSIYTSFDVIKKYKSWDEVTVTYNGDTKDISNRKYNDLTYKMIQKRIVGKVQPEKSKERSKYNFTIDIKGNKYKLKVDTMGKDYVKITYNSDVAYYEVHESLYNYLKNDIFKIGQPKKWWQTIFE
jgi:hypothetical protein